MTHTFACWISRHFIRLMGLCVVYSKYKRATLCCIQTYMALMVVSNMVILVKCVLVCRAMDYIYLPSIIISHVILDSFEGSINNVTVV